MKLGIGSKKHKKKYVKNRSVRRRQRQQQKNEESEESEDEQLESKCTQLRYLLKDPKGNFLKWASKKLRGGGKGIIKTPMQVAKEKRALKKKVRLAGIMMMAFISCITAIILTIYLI